jgi:hypothetical protein
VKSTPEHKTGAGFTRAAADGDEEEEGTESQPPDAATAAQLKAPEDALKEAQEAAILTTTFLYNADKSKFRGLMAYMNGLTTITYAIFFCITLISFPNGLQNKHAGIQDPPNFCL